MYNITVSIFMLTYNQDQFIAQTIESILMQKTSFNFQLVIGEDCSSDSTRLICEHYALEYPDKVKLLPALEENIGLIANYMRTIRECNGKYIAICDGDDYWIDEFKLQKQVDFLEAHSDYSIIYSGYNKLYPDGTLKKAVLSFTQPESSFSDLIYDNYIASVTVLFRNDKSLSKLPNWITKLPYGDWPTYLWLIKDKGKIHFLNEVTAVYRMGIGVSSSIIKYNSVLLKVNLRILNFMLNDANFKSKEALIRTVILGKMKSLMISYNREKKYLKGLKQLKINFTKNENKAALIKLYLYSIYKNFV
ncbi:glycosyltransferase [Tamlana sp. s12]|uniref:glycosyltransferase n=1 Tax=Tamlana sp. s12 TaxID=1630406 RepID=UPI0007FC26D3|nr:glycosyltransferase [Tamlana sp. s12]OBQ55396.1 glycosyl transferase [Tamlana sp. s12]QQY80925.1 glycosyltransferase [Tamlana sp. s12]